MNDAGQVKTAGAVPVPTTPDLKDKTEREEAERNLNAAPKFEESKSFKLTVPVKVKDQNGVESLKTEVTLRAPSAMDLWECGDPPNKTKWLSNPSSMIIETNPEQSKAWIQRLSNLEMPILYRIAARDIRAMNAWITAELNAGSGN